VRPWTRVNRALESPQRCSTSRPGHCREASEAGRRFDPRSYTEGAAKGHKLGDEITPEILDQLETSGWEPYHDAVDPTRDPRPCRRASHKLRELVSLWWVGAGKYKVLPIDGSLMLRFTTDRLHLTRARSSYVFYPGLSVVPIGSAPAVFNRPHSITAEVEIPDGGATRVVGTAPPKDVGCDYGREVSGPSWSPDGSEIAFGVTDCADQTYVVPAAGGNRRLVGDGSQTVWSPDGEHIAVVSYNGDLVVMRPDGSAQLVVTFDSAGGGIFSWSPDSTRIAFDRRKDGKSSVAVATIDGGTVHVLPGHWRHPVWATLPSPLIEDDLSP